ncbi:MAG: hypothetical protein HY246_04725 [Proteobacteria bacterium]|nr:hypothetical protein [Pseudomonadota bacterium]
MDHFPIFLELKGQRVLLVGDTATVTRKAALLIRAGARLRVVAPTLDEAFAAWRARGLVEHRAEAFAPDHLAGCALAIGATGDAATDAAVATAARARHLPVNIVDRPELCSFIMPAIVDRSPLVMAISSGGTAPTLARLLRARIESLVPAGYGRLAELAGAMRAEVRHRLPDGAARRRFWAGAFTGRVADLVFAGRVGAARSALRQALDRAGLPTMGPPMGMVAMVGAGPGDPELLTVKAVLHSAIAMRRSRRWRRRGSTARWYPASWRRPVAQPMPASH